MEGGLYKSKHVEGTLQNDKRLFILYCAISEIKYVIVRIVQWVWITLN
jgi:hypothetical protein